MQLITAAQRVRRLRMSSSAEQQGLWPIDLLWVGGGIWAACDTGVPESDPRRVVAKLECKDHRVRVQWLLDGREPLQRDSLREALRTVRDMYTPGGAD
jgi:hypothetical protein